LITPGDDFQERRLAGAILADDAERRAACEFERDVIQRAENLRRAAPAQ
jgi:hypothetical protein